MLFQRLVQTALVAGAWAAPTPSQLPNDGFPSPSADQLKVIEKAADGTLSNAPPPAALNSSSIPIFQLITFNENFEVAFFNSLLYNVTNHVPGFEAPLGTEKTALLSVLKTVLAVRPPPSLSAVLPHHWTSPLTRTQQEELHAINAAGVVAHFNGTVPLPCTYQFPTTSLGAAIALAETFTSVVLGTLQDAAEGLSVNGDHGPVRAVASVIGQEGEQNGFFRTLLNRKPSQKPFLTTSVAAFAFSALQGFVVSCPFDVAATIPIPIFPPLAVQGGDDVAAQDQVLRFSANLAGVQAAAPYYGSADAAAGALFVTYLTGQDTPVSQPIGNVTWGGDDGKSITFTAEFPFDEFVMDGLSIAALTVGGSFASADDLPASTLAAPGLIQVNDPIV